MGLLDDFPYGLLNLSWNAPPSRIPIGNFGAGDANGFPSQVPQQQQQRLPLSFAGPDLTADITAPSPSRSADFLRAQPSALPTRNLTTQALRMKGVPEAEIAAAAGNPELLKQLIIQQYGTGSPGFAASARSSSERSGADRSSSGESDVDVKSDPTLSPSMRANIGTCSPKPNLGHGSEQAGITSDKSVYCRTMRSLCIRECDHTLGGPDSFGAQRACIRTCMHNAGCFDF
jgi:hypothetical protein